jgi:hypothetical protein
MITQGLFSSNTNEWATPRAVFDALDAEFHFNLDPCSTHENAKCEKHYTIEDDGLTKNWGVQSVLQSSIRKGVAEMGAEVFRGSKEAGHPGGYAHTRQDGHRIFPRLHLPSGEGNSFPSWPSTFQ